MNIMEKFQNGIESVLVPIAAKLNSQRHICAVRDAFILSFPLTMAGSLMVLLNFVLLSPDGFIAKLLRLESVYIQSCFKRFSRYIIDTSSFPNS